MIQATMKMIKMNPLTFKRKNVFIIKSSNLKIKMPKMKSKKMKKIFIISIKAQQVKIYFYILCATISYPMNIRDILIIQAK